MSRIVQWILFQMALFKWHHFNDLSFWRFFPSFVGILLVLAYLLGLCLVGSSQS